MRKRFPAPKGLGSRSYADRYAEARRNRGAKDNGKTNPKVKFLGSKKPLKFKFRKTALETGNDHGGVFFLLLSLPPLVVALSILFGG
ncbi:MAG: hypothetical protein ACJAQT_001716 [Akkermansiaceae bacterium]|jgi:hypothetical protein